MQEPEVSSTLKSITINSEAIWKAAVSDRAGKVSNFVKAASLMPQQLPLNVFQKKKIHQIRTEGTGQTAEKKRNLVKRKRVCWINGRMTTGDETVT